MHAAFLIHAILLSMDSKVDFQSLLSDTRARVYLLWAFLTAVGYIATHFYQVRLINGFWLLLSITGLGYMLRVMPIRVMQMKKIYLSWLIPIGFGLFMSMIAFASNSFAELIGYLGAFWLIVQAAGFFWNGLVDSPAKWYYIVAAVNLVAGLLCYSLDSLLPIQYLIAAIVSAWSMLMLWIFRT